MQDEKIMRPFGPEEVEPEEAIRKAREEERKAQQAELDRLMKAQERPKRDPLQELADLLDQVDAESAQQIAKYKRKHMSRCAMFSAAAVAVVSCMFWGLADPVFALPLATVYCMRGAVSFDRWARV